MQNTLERTHHYFDLAQQMQKAAEMEPDPIRQNELSGLSEQYARLAMKLMQEHTCGGPANRHPDHDGKSCGLTNGP